MDARVRRRFLPSDLLRVFSWASPLTLSVCSVPMTLSPASEQEQAPEPPRGHVRMVYLGPVAPHWEVESEFGDRSLIEEFRQRALARLVLLPPHDPQFRRNRERIVRDAERENIILEWDLGIPEEEVEPPA